MGRAPPAHTRLPSQRAAPDAITVMLHPATEAMTAKIESLEKQLYDAKTQLTKQNHQRSRADALERENATLKESLEKKAEREISAYVKKKKGEDCRRGALDVVKVDASAREGAALIRSS